MRWAIRIQSPKLRGLASSQVREINFGDKFRGQISGTGNELQPMGRLASLNEKGNSYPVPEITVPEITAGSESRYLPATCNQKKSCIPMRHISA